MLFRSGTSDLAKKMKSILRSLRWRNREHLRSVACIQSLEQRLLLSHTNTENLWGTYFGGNGTTNIRDVAVDKNHNFYVTGGTNAPNFPTTPGAYDISANGNWDAFVAKFDS